MIEFGAWLCEDVLEKVPHRQWVFTIPKILRSFFMTDRRLIRKLSRCAWQVLRLCLTESVESEDAMPGATIAVQTFGDFQNFNPHLHIIATDGCFHGNGKFHIVKPPDRYIVEYIFRDKVFQLLKSEGKIGDVLIANMMNWRHSGFNVYIGDPVKPTDHQGLENLSRYIIRASFSQKRMTYIHAGDNTGGQGRVIYHSKDGATSESFDALDWLAQLTSHIPNRGEQMVRYYGYYSNKCRGQRKKAGRDEILPSITGISVPSSSRKHWAQLIQKTYNVDPLCCPKCKGRMRIIAFIDSDEVIRKILVHLNLWEVRNHDPPDLIEGRIVDQIIDRSYSQLPYSTRLMYT